MTPKASEQQRLDVRARYLGSHIILIAPVARMSAVFGGVPSLFSTRVGFN